MLSKYFFEIKNRSALICFSWVITILTCYSYKETLLYITLKNILSNDSFYLITTTITEIFSSYLKLTYFLTNQLTLIFFLYQLYKFLKPGLYFSESKNLKIIVSVVSSVSLVNLLALNYFILPICWEFFLSFNENSTSNPINLYFEGKLNEYVSFYVSLYGWCNITVQLLLLQGLILDYLPNKLEIIKNNRKIFYLNFLIIATVISPPDVFSQLLLATSFTIFFEVLVLLIIIKNSLVRQPIETN